MSHSARDSIQQALASTPLIDSCTHIDPHQPACNTLTDLLRTSLPRPGGDESELVKATLQQSGHHPKQQAQSLLPHLESIENTATYQWLIDTCQMHFGFQDNRISPSNWESLFDAAERKLSSAQWPQMVLQQSNIQCVFFASSFDDELSHFDGQTYSASLQADEFVFDLTSPSVRDRLTAACETPIDGSLQTLRSIVENRVRHFAGGGGRACMVSLPGGFTPSPVSDGRAKHALDQVLRRGELARSPDQKALAERVFWTLAELCDQYQLPLQLRIGGRTENRLDGQASLTHLRQLLGSFQRVKFVVSATTRQPGRGLIDLAIDHPNVFIGGHDLGGGTPAKIARDAIDCLESVPASKQIGYHSGAGKIEWIGPKFRMYRRILADLLAEHFVGRRGWPQQQAVDLGQQILRGNIDAIFPSAATKSDCDPAGDQDREAVDLTVHQLLSASSPTTLAAGAIGMVEVDLNPIDAIDDLDPSPSQGEVDMLEVADVELSGSKLLNLRRESERIDEIDPDALSLNVGDLFEDDTDPATLNSEIKPLRYEGSFIPEEDSLQLAPDPLTGELTFQEKSSGDNNDAAEFDDAKDDQLDLEEIDLEDNDNDGFPGNVDDDDRKRTS